MKIATACCWCALVMIFSPAGYVQADDLSAEQLELIKMIGEQNRANRKILTSLSLQFTGERRTGFNDQGEPGQVLKKTGSYAFDGDREYSHDVIPEQGIDLTYARSGNQARTASQKNPRSVTMGLATNPSLRKGTPDPWSLMIEDIGSRIDRLTPEQGKIVAVDEVVQENGSPAIRVKVENTRNEPNGEQYHDQYDIYFSKADGYLPTRVSGKMLNGPQTNVLAIALCQITEMKKVEVDGKVVFIPLQYHESAIIENKKALETEYRVDADSLKINPKLPDDLFTIPILPGDQVFNLDIGLVLPNPFARELLLPETTSMPATSPQNNSAQSPQADTTHSREADEFNNEVRAIMSPTKGINYPLIGLILLGIGIVVGYAIYIRYIRNRGNQ